MQIDVSKLMDKTRPHARAGAGRVRLVVRRMFSGVSLAKLEPFYFQLSTMLSSGVPIREALYTLAGQHRGRAGRLFKEMADEVGDGDLLSVSMEKRPHVFDALAVGMVRTGELTGRLDENLNLVGQSIERIRNLRSRLITAMLYPLILLHLGVIIPNILLLVTVGFWAFFVATVKTLIPLYLLLFFIWFMHQVLRETKGYGEFLLGMFFFGGIFRRFALARFSRALAALYDAGVPLDKAVESAAETAGNGAIRAVLEDVSARIKVGTMLSTALETARHIPVMVKNMISTGEHSGRLEETLRKIADYYEQEATTAVRRVARVLPVILYLMIAGWIAWQVVSFYLDYYGPFLR